MTYRQTLKHFIYSRCPGFRGSFPYCGARTYFPSSSVLFLKACEQGIYEANIVRLLARMTTAETYMYDVGANIGLTSLPVLAWAPGSRVVSFEPSPNALDYLEKTHRGSPYCDRWQVIGRAVGKEVGTVSFSVSGPSHGDYDGLVDTHRSGERQTVTVPITTLDAFWDNAGRPRVSTIKLDIEGAETAALVGACNLIENQRPAIILEWYEENLTAYGYRSESLLSIADSLGYLVLSVPNLVTINEASTLLAHMLFAEAFLLLPKTRD